MDHGAMMEENSKFSGVRVVAVVEGAKSVLVVAAGFGLLSLLHRDMAAFALRLIELLHLNPGHKYPRIFIEAARNLTDAHLALADALVRGILAFGLWRERIWAEWLGVVAGAIYMPWEVYMLTRGLTSFRLVVFVINAALVIYLGFTAFRSNRNPNPESRTS